MFGKNKDKKTLTKEEYEELRKLALQANNLKRMLDELGCTPKEDNEMSLIAGVKELDKQRFQQAQTYLDGLHRKLMGVLVGNPPNIQSTLVHEEDDNGSS